VSEFYIFSEGEIFALFNIRQGKLAPEVLTYVIRTDNHVHLQLFAHCLLFTIFINLNSFYGSRSENKYTMYVFRDFCFEL